MVDFRYHALSLVAVFLALGIGVVLGVTVGDSLVSDADQNLRESLRDDVTEAREEVRDQQELGSRREDVIEETAPEVAAGRLRGRRVALIALGDLPGNVSEGVADAVELGGGRLVRTAVVSPPDDTPALFRRASLPRTVTARGLERQARVGAQVGRLVESGGPAAKRLRRALPDRFTGRWARPANAVVVYRHPPPDAEGDEAGGELERREAFENGMFEGLRDNVAGVEVLDTDPSQVEWFDFQRMASVDNVDLVAGQLALVLLIQEAARADLSGERPEGSFGYKDSSGRALPDLSE